MSITAFIENVQQELPLTLAMPDDPVGLQVLPEEGELRGVAVAYEATEEVIEQADASGANLLIVFHPLIYPAIANITPANRVERCVISLIQRRIALYVVHTAFDAHPRGTSRLLAEHLGLEKAQPIVPSRTIPDAGMGAIGELRQPISLHELGERLRAACSTECVRISAPSDQAMARQVRRLGILGGSGMSFYEQAVAAGADAFVTADVRYHAFHAANDRIPVLDPGHAESERFVADGLTDLLRSVIDDTAPSVPLTRIAVPTNPVRYVTGR